MFDLNGLAVIADGKSATVYRNHAHEGIALEKLATIDHKSLHSDGAADRRSDSKNREDVQEAQFAKLLAQRIGALVAEHKATQVIIAADPAMLGHLRQAYPQALKPLIVKELHKDLTKLNGEDLAKAIA